MCCREPKWIHYKLFWGRRSVSHNPHQLMEFSMDSCHGGKGLNLNLIPVSTVVNLGEFSCHGYNNKNMVKKKKNHSWLSVKNNKTNGCLPCSSLTFHSYQSPDSIFYIPNFTTVPCQGVTLCLHSGLTSCRKIAGDKTSSKYPQVSWINNFFFATEMGWNIHRHPSLYPVVWLDWRSVVWQPCWLL